MKELTYSNPISRLSLTVSYGDVENAIMLDKVITQVKAGDMNPNLLINEYFKTQNEEWRKDFHKNLLDSITYYNGYDGSVNDLDKTHIVKAIEMIDFDRFVTFISGRVDAPPEQKQMDKDTFNKDPIRTYDERDYHELVSLVHMFTMLSPQLGRILLRLRPKSNHKIVAALMVQLFPLFSHLPIFKKYILHTEAIVTAQGNNIKQLVLSKSMCINDIVYDIALSTILGRYSTHNVLEDTNIKNIVKRLHNVVDGKSTVKSITERTNKIAGEPISPYDMDIVFDVKPYLMMEDQWIMEDPIFFASQYGSLTNKQLKDLNYGMENCGLVFSEEKLAITSVATKDYINPKSIEMLGDIRPGVNAISPIIVLRGTAYMLTIDKFPNIANLIISEELVYDEEDSGLILGNENILKIKEGDIVGHEFINKQLLINQINNVSKIWDKRHYLKGDYESELLPYGNFKFELLDYINYFDQESQRKNKEK